MADDSQRFVADHVVSLPRSGIRDFFAIVAAMPQAISLGIGEPDFVTPSKKVRPAIPTISASSVCAVRSILTSSIILS
jgi:hypothetical protein